MRVLRSAAIGTAAVVVAVGAATLVGGRGRTVDVPAGPRLDLVVLLVTDGGPNTAAVEEHLRTDGIPYRAIDLRRSDRPRVTAEFLADADGPNFQAVVVPSAAALAEPSELAALHDYERRYGIRQVDAYQWPGPEVGLRTPAYSGPLDGSTAEVTASGRSAPFAYLRGPVPFADDQPGKPETYGYLANPAAGTAGRVTELVQGRAPGGGARGVLVGSYSDAGREELFLTFAFNADQQQFRLLAPGVVDWATRGVHLGHRRNYLSVHVDDVLLADRRWSVTGDCTPGEDCTGGQQTADIRMSAADVAHAVRWQDEQGLRLDMVFNGAGSDEAARGDAGGSDELTQALVAAAGHFRWINHTYSHQYLGCLQDAGVTPWRCRTEGNDTLYVGADLIIEEIDRNITWGREHGLELRADELVTGEHSGLRNPPRQPADNPGLSTAVDDTKVRWLAADASRMPVPEKIGRSWTVPRHPINLFFNVGTAGEEADEYNWLYTARADGGSGLCTEHPDTSTCRTPLDPTRGYVDVVLPAEAAAILARVQDNDPRPHYVHQSNLAEERLLYPLLERVLDDYRQLYADDSPIVCQRMADSGVALRRQAEWAEAVASGRAGGFVVAGRIFTRAPGGVLVPLTVPLGTTTGGRAFGEVYAGTSSAWAPAGQEVTLP